MTKQKRPSAYNLALQQVQQHAPQDSKEVPDGDKAVEHHEEVIPQNSATPQNRSTQLEKVTFYLEADQVEKLFDLVHDYRKRTGIRINRNDVIRRLIDVATIDTVLPSNTVKP